MFAGDNFKPPANSSYRNLSWQRFHVDNSFDIGTRIQRNKEIGTIDTWGPFFRISFDLIIYSNHITSDEWSSVLTFSGSAPVILFHRTLGLVNIVNKKRLNFNIELNRWYSIIIEQQSVNGKVIWLHHIKYQNHSIFIIRLFSLLQLMGNGLIAFHFLIQWPLKMLE